MKPILLLLFISLFFGISLHAQDEEFLWVKSFEISNCNEVGALTIDTSDNIIIAGVHEGPFSLPFKGDVYIKKTDADGINIWENNMEGEIIVADMKAIHTDLFITGQAYGTITYKGFEYGGAPYFLYLFKLDENGDVQWIYINEAKLGTYANLAEGDNNRLVLHARTQSNQGDWIMVFDAEGNMVQSRLLHPTITMIDDIAQYQGNLYLSGDINGLSGVTIDTIYIPQSPLESTAFVLSLDSALTARWVSIDTTLNNSNGKVEVNENGVFVFQETLEAPFTIKSYLKHFNHSGNLINEAEIPVFSNGAALLPDMALTGDRVALFVKNSFTSDNFKVLIYNEDLEIINEKIITGTSDQFSNHIDCQDKNYVISHVYESTLNLNGELTLPYEGTGKLPYIAKIGSPEIISNSGSRHENSRDLFLFPNPARDFVKISISDYNASTLSVKIINGAGKIVLESKLDSSDTKIDLTSLPKGLYLVKIFSGNNDCTTEKLLIH